MATNLNQIRIEASLDASNYIQNAQRKADADAKMIKSSDDLGKSLDATDRRLNQNTGFNKFLQSNDQALKVTSLYEAGLRRLQAAIEAGVITAPAVAARQLDQLTLRYNAGLAAAAKNEEALRRLSSTTGGFTQSLRQNQIAFLELQAAGINSFQALASGITPFRVAITEGAQVLGALVQGTQPLFRLSSLFGPIGIAAAAAATSIGLLVGAVVRATSTESNIRSFTAALGDLSNAGRVTGADLQKAFEAIRNSGTSASEALTAIQMVARNPLIDRARAEEVITVARDISTITGEDLPTATKSLTSALTGTVDGFIKYAEGLDRLTGPELDAIRQTGNLSLGLQLLKERLSGEFTRSLSDTQRLTNELSSSFNRFWDALSNSSVVQEFLRDTKTILDFFTDLPSKVSSAIDALKRFGAEAAPSATASIPSAGLTGASADEVSLLAQIRQRESGGVYSTFHATGATVSSLADVEAFSGKSHAFGAYGFQPGTYRGLAQVLGFDANDISAAKQDLAALLLLRDKGANSSSSWAASAPRGGYPSLAGGATGSAIAADNLKVEESIREINKALREQGAQAAATSAFDKTYHEELDKTHDSTVAWDRANIAFNQEFTKTTIEYDKAAKAAAVLTQGTLNAADATRVSIGQGAIANAQTQAAIELTRTFGEGQFTAGQLAQKTTEILTQQAAEAIKLGEEQNAITKLTLASSQSLIDAAGKGASAFREAQAVQQASTQFAAEYDAAIKSGNLGLAARIEALRAESVEQAKANQAVQESVQLNQRAQQVGQDVRVVQLETQLELEGKSAAEIANQVSQLRLRQDLETKYPDAQSEVKANIIAQVEAFGQANIKLDEARQRTERWNEEIRNIAETIASAIGSALDDLLSGKKITDWGDRFKKVISEIASQIIQAEVIRPTIGSALQGLGASSQVVSQFGTFGQGGGILSSLFGGGGPLSSLFGGGQSGGLLSSIFGTAGTSGVNALSGAELAELGVPGASGGLFGGALGGIGGALGGIGLGATAGSLLSSLLGGKSTGGTLGSLGGSAAGALIGSIVPGIGTIIGGLIGGLFGGAGGGLIGPKPSTLASGSAIDLATGRVGDFRSSGNAQNDQTVQNISSTLSKFLQQLEQTTGGNVGGGSLNVVATTKGIQTHYSGPLGDISGTFSSIDEAVSAIEKAFLQNITGVNDHIKTALAHITDPSQIQAALQAVQIYDAAITTSFGAVTKATTDASALFSQSSLQISSAFDQVSQQVGPYAKAFDQINSQFTAASAGVTQQREVLLAQATALKQTAQQFGLSLDGIDDAFMKAADTLNETQNSLDNAQREALARLAKNFNQNIAAALRETADPFGAAVDAALQQNQQRLTDAKALGVDLAQVQQYNSQSLERVLLQASNALGGTTSRTTASLGMLAKSLDVLFQSLEQNLQTTRTIINASGVTQLTGSDPFSQIYNQIRTQIAAEIRANLEVQHQNNPAVIPTIETPEVQALIQQEHDAVHRLALDFNQQIGVLLTGITDPAAAAIQAEKIAGDNRVAIAKTIGADLTQVEAYNAASLQKVIDSLNQTSTAANDFAGTLSQIAASLDGTVASLVKNQTPFRQAINALNEAYLAALNQFGGKVPNAAEQATGSYFGNVNALRDAFNAQINLLSGQITDPLQAAINVERDAGAQRLQDAKDLGADLAAVARYNELNLQKVIQSFSNASSSAQDFSNVLGDIAASLDSSVASIVKNETPFRQAINALNAAYLQALNQFGGKVPNAAETATASYAGNIGALRNAFNANINLLLGQITDPLQAAINVEKEAGLQRIQDAKDLGGNLAQVNEYNKQSLLNVIKSTQNAIQDLTGAFNTLRQTLQALRSGPLSGLTPAQNVSATALMFRNELATVRGGNLAEIQNLAQAGTAAVQAAQQAYGNAPQTAAIRNEVIAGLKEIKALIASQPHGAEVDAAFAVAARGYIPGFASGTLNTPRGAIIVGERGPELLYQHGGNTVVPFDKMIAANENAMSDVKDLLRAILRQTQAGQGQANKDAKMIAGETAVVGRKLSSYSPPRMRAVS